MQKTGLFVLLTLLSFIIVIVINPYGIQQKLFPKSAETTQSDAETEDESLLPRPNPNVILSITEEPIEDPGSGLRPFFSLLGGGGQIRIAYFGDSMIEGDLVTQTFRQLLQQNYGAGGIGFIPITSETAQFRGTIKHDFSSNWQRFTLLTSKPPDCAYGISGYTFKTTGDSLDAEDYPWVEYTLKDNSSRFVRLFYSAQGSPGKFSYSLSGGELNEKEIPAVAGVGEVSIELSDSKNIRFIFPPQKDLCLYGVSFENGSGVVVDNFALRGHSGLNLAKIAPGTMSAFNNLLGYDLIVLQYGANISDESVEEFGWYESGMKSVIQKLKTGMSGVPVLVVSSTDREYKDERGFHSSPVITKLVRAQKNAALKSGAAFWNLYEVMGGDNSMFAWVSNGLAASDYTHLTGVGAKKVGKLLYTALIQRSN
ncbi:MAG: hypothetical protein AB9882_09915 [Ignavibacteriaceae bacterium]